MAGEDIEKINKSKELIQKGRRKDKNNQEKENIKSNYDNFGEGKKQKI